MAAQQTELRLESAVSHARPPSGIAVDSRTYLTAALRFGHAGPVSVFAGADGGWGLDGQESDWTSGYAGIGVARSLGESYRLGATLSGSGFDVEGPVRYRALVARLDPTLSIFSGGTRWDLRLHGAVGRTRVGEGLDEVEADEWMGGAGLGFRTAVGAGVTEGHGDAIHTDAGTWLQAGVAFERAVGPASLRFATSAWREPGGHSEIAGLLRLDVPLGRVLRFVASGGRSDPDPLLGTPPGGYGSVALSLDLLGALRAPPVPVAAILEGSPTRARFSVRPRAAGTVELLGDFTEWEPVPMLRGDDGRWEAIVEVPPGVHHFGFKVDGAWWVPEDAPGRGEDEWGRATATMVVGDA